MTTLYTLELTGNTDYGRSAPCSSALSFSTHSPLPSTLALCVRLSVVVSAFTPQRSTPTRARRNFVLKSTFDPIVGPDDDNGGRLLIPGSRAQGFSPHPPRTFQYIYVEPILVD
ncbi:hypothetical protein D9757_012952 [Collybiopsis confluens]|uniref:Uncharacterized protein n=1 Tax=Collybiopsis confluens TaxID=2823264 RepID=A0A8H5LIP9_9AGAR|nr:hypothetical protein D9757_012952 [Collybiopsis confluens]